MYKCNLCERSFSRRANLTQHYNQLHPYTQSSWTLDWIQNQKYENLLQRKPLQSLDNNIQKEFDGLNSLLQKANDGENFSLKFASDNQNLSSSQNKNMEEKNENIEEENENMEKENENIEEESENMEEESEISKDSDESTSSVGDIEDFRSGSFIAAIDDLNSNIDKQEKIVWPSDTYKEFMTNVTRYHLSDAAGDAMLHMLRKNCTEKLPASTRKGREYMDKMDIKGLHLKTIDLVEFEGKIYKLQYRPIIDAIKGLTSNNELCKYFLLNYEEEWEARDVSKIF
jgi:hypothetical protein